MNTILLAVKGPESDAAVRWVARRAGRSETTVDVVSVVTREGEEAARSVADRAAQLLAELAPAVRVTTHTPAGDVVDTLLGLSAAVDILVVGSDRSRPIAAAFHATVPMRLSGRSERDLVVVPAGWTERDPGPVIAGWNQEPGAHAVVDAAVREAVATGSSLRIVHVWSVPLSLASADGIGLDRVMESVEQEAAAALAVVADSVRERHPDLELTTDLQLASVVAGLTAESHGASVIVVGSHRDSAIGQIVFGSTGDALIRHSDDTPILVVGFGDEGREERPL